MTRVGDGPRRRRMIRGTIVRIGGFAMRYGHLSQLATLDCTSSRRSTVMCALPRAIAVTTEYQRDSSSKRPRSSVVFAARAPTRVQYHVARAVGRSDAGKLTLARHVPSRERRIGDLTSGHSISASGFKAALAELGKPNAGASKQ
jgi:hypothetical protein